MLKRISLILAALAPITVIAFLTLVPSADVSANLPLFHFYVVTFTTFSAAVVSILLGATLVQEAETRHVLAATAFAFIGSMFFSHGVATPGALIETFHPALRWSAWLTLFGGGGLFAIASLDIKKTPLRLIINISVGGMLIYWGIAAFGSNYLDLIEKQAAPWHRETIFYLSLFFWLFAAARFWWIARANPNRVDTTLAMVAFWMAAAVISMHRYPLWKLSWWMYHIIMLFGFLITIGILAVEYERVRRFNLVRYYVAASLITTALLALVASALFTQFSYSTAVAQIENSARNIAQNIASGVTAELEDSKATSLSQPSLADWRNIITQRIKGFSAMDVTIFDPSGIIIYSTQQTWIGVRGNMDEDIRRTLAGQTFVEICEPGNPPDLYLSNPVSKEPKNTYIIETYAPVRSSNNSTASPIGIVVTFQDAPELSQVNIRARAIGLITAFFTMGLLFFALLTVVSRADKVITSRTDELATAYTNLRQAEAMRDDLTNMIAHDLRNPLTAITASIDLLNKPGLNAREDTRKSLINNARAASKRMTELIDDLLTVGKIESGELKLNLETVAVARLLAERVETFTTQAVAENKTITFNCSPELDMTADAHLLGRVIDNLIGNAFKYIDYGGKVQVTGRSEDGKVFLSVRDSGSGVPDAFKEKIFEKFVQAPNAEERPTRKGTGLGLAFCRLVVELHGGKIWVQDVPEGGSEFVLWIPKN